MQQHPASAFYLGMDVARVEDLCVIDVGEKLGDVMWDRFRLELKDKRFAEIKASLYPILEQPSLKRACIDNSPIGRQLAEESRERFGWKVEQFDFTPASKEDLAFGLRRDFEDLKLRLVRDDKLRADLHGLRKGLTATGKIRFDGHADDSHCDRTWAMALRQEAARYREEVWALLG
jgi:phage FluMu gp28-like protein